MSHICLKCTIEKNWHSPDFHFISSENLSAGQFLRSSNSQRHHWILTSFCNLKKKQGYGTKSMCGFSKIPVLKGIMTFWTKRVHPFCWTKTQILIKTKWNQKWKIPDVLLERQTLCFSSYKYHKLKENCHELDLMKKSAFFVTFMKKTFLKFCFYLNL